MSRELQELYPLPSGWNVLEQFTDTVDLEGGAVELSGFAVAGPQGERVTGSAASRQGSASCVDRSYFETLERVSVAMALSVANSAYEVRDRTGQRRGRVRRPDVFSESPSPERWRPARSNGVALHTTWRGACDRAAAELVERDRVLRSWYGESVPRKCALPDGLIPLGLTRLASWKAYELAPGAVTLLPDLTVVVVVGFPRSCTSPVTYGFGAHLSAELATKAAVTEAVQRFGFLFGEAIPKEAPGLSPTPDFHQEFFLFPPSHRLLADWLDKNTERPQERGGVALGGDCRNPGGAEFLFVDITPRELQGRVWVAKAVCPFAEPLVFGEPAPHRAAVHRDRRVHPIA